MGLCRVYVGVARLPFPDCPRACMFDVGLGPCPLMGQKGRAFRFEFVLYLTTNTRFESGLINFLFTYAANFTLICQLPNQCASKTSSLREPLGMIGT